MKIDYISLDVKDKLIQLRVSNSDKKILHDYAKNKGGLSYWLLNLALKEAGKK